MRGVFLGIGLLTLIGAAGRIVYEQSGLAIASNAALKQLSKELAHKPDHGLAIIHVGLFEPETATVKLKQTVVVAGGIIQATGDDGSVSIPRGCELIDGTAETLLPGLFDMHTHLQPSAGLALIASGVTTVRDLGNQMENLLALKRKWDSGEETGPRILMAGPINGSRGKGVLVKTEHDVQAAIDRFKAAGYVQMKILGNLRPELVPYVAQAAHAEGMRVSGHVPEGMRADQFVNAGVDEIQHMNFILENFLPPGIYFDAAAREGGNLDLHSDSVSRFINLLKQKHIVVDPTLNVFEAKYERRAEFQKYYSAMTGMLKRLYDAGVSLVVGTDGPRSPGVSLHREMEIWVSAGIPAPRVLQMATIGAARVMRVDAEIGSVRAGKKADLALIDGDPINSISDIRKCKIVVKDGVVYISEDVRRAVSVRLKE
jgi:imidazolonepropionase-like amidohydrolase